MSGFITNKVLADVLFLTATCSVEILLQYDIIRKVFIFQVSKRS